MCHLQCSVVILHTKELRLLPNGGGGCLVQVLHQARTERVKKRVGEEIYSEPVRFIGLELLENGNACGNFFPSFFLSFFFFSFFLSFFLFSFFLPNGRLNRAVHGVLRQDKIKHCKGVYRLGE